MSIYLNGKVVSGGGNASLNEVYPRFCINSGSVNYKGEPNFIQVGEGIVTAKAPFVFTTASGKTYKVTEDLVKTTEDAFAGLLLVDVVNNEPQLVLGGEYFIQKYAPDNPIEDYSVWLNTSVYPELAYLYTSNGWVETNRVPIGSISIATAPDLEIPDSGEEPDIISPTLSEEPEVSEPTSPTEEIIEEEEPSL